MCVEVLTNTIESSQLPKLRTKVVRIFSNQCIKKQQCSEISPMFLIRECGSTPYVGLAHAVPPTNTKFKPLLLPTQAGVPYTSTEHHISSLSHLWVQLSTDVNFWRALITDISCDLFIIIINFFRRVFSAYTEANTTSLIPQDTILPKTCAFIVGFICTV